MNRPFIPVYPSSHPGHVPPTPNPISQASWPIDPNYQSVPTPRGQQVPYQVMNPLRPQQAMNPLKSQLETVARAAMDMGSLSIQPQSVSSMHPPPQPPIRPQSVSPMYPPSQQVPFQPSFQIGPPINPLYPQPPTGPAALRRSAPRAFSADPRLLSKHDFDRRIAAENENFRAMEEERRRSFSNAKPYPPHQNVQGVQPRTSQQPQRQESNEDFLKQVNLNKIEVEKGEGARSTKAERRQAKRQEEKESLEALRVQRIEMEQRELRYEEMKVNVVKLDSSSGEPVLLRWDPVEMQVLGDHLVE